MSGNASHDHHRVSGGSVQQRTIIIVVVVIVIGAVIRSVIVIGAVNTSLSGRGVEALPLSAVGVIYGVDRILDMCRTVVNVWGDATGAKIMTRLTGKDDDLVEGTKAG